MGLFQFFEKYIFNVFLAVAFIIFKIYQGRIYYYAPMFSIGFDKKSVDQFKIDSFLIFFYFLVFIRTSHNLSDVDNFFSPKIVFCVKSLRKASSTSKPKILLIERQTFS